MRFRRLLGPFRSRFCSSGSILALFNGILVAKSATLHENAPACNVQRSVWDAFDTPFESERIKAFKPSGQSNVLNNASGASADDDYDRFDESAELSSNLGFGAARISVSNLHKSTDKVFSDVVEKLHKHVHPKTKKPASLIADDVYEVIMYVSRRPRITKRRFEDAARRT